MAMPRPMRDFAQKGVGVKTLLHSEGRDTDFPGCYVMLDRDQPTYVGISRKVSLASDSTYWRTPTPPQPWRTEWPLHGQVAPCAGRKRWRIPSSGASSTERAT